MPDGLILLHAAMVDGEAPIGYSPGMSRFCLALIPIMMCFSLGCASAPQGRRVALLDGASHTYVVHLPGMAGWTNWDTNFLQGLGDAGFARHLEVYDWTSPHWMIGAVWAYDHNRKAACYVADRIAAKLRAEPDAKIILTGWSAGGAVAIWTLEDLPEGMQVQTVLLVQPAVDPDHDLTRALRHVCGHLFATESGGDFLMLGIGTTIFGTTDGGAHVAAAGDAGFRKPPTCDPAEYEKLVEIPYELRWMRLGNFGGHLGPMERGFAKTVLGPKLATDANIRSIK